MTSCNLRRPTAFTCACGTVVQVAPRGRVPSACRQCSAARLAARVYVYEPTDPRELGPERPLLGMSEDEALEWRRMRAVHLYRAEPELRLSDLGERLGVSAKQVGEYLREAGLSVRKDGRDSLPAGPPVR